MLDDGRRRNEFDDGDTAEADEDEREPRTIHISLNPVLERISWVRLVLIAAILGGAVFVGYTIYRFITLEGAGGPSEGLEGVVLLVAGFVTVALLLYLGTLVHRALDMGAPAEALGMPAGSIRALIAMSLILIFAIIGILVFNQGAAGSETVSSGVTQEQIDALRADGAIVVSQTLQTPVPAPPAAPLYDVITRTAMSREAHDFGLQLMTTVSTLVVAVAGFYFGARAVSQASTSVQEQLRLARSFQGPPRRSEVIGPRVDPDAPTDEAPPGTGLEEEVAEIDDDDALAEAEAETEPEPEAETEAEDEDAAGDELRDVPGDVPGDGPRDIPGDEDAAGDETTTEEDQSTRP